MMITGKHGFIGRELAKRKLTDGVYYFGSPSSNILFEEDISSCMRETIDGFLNILDRCKTTGEYLVYPSSATVVNKNNPYAHCKAILEELARAYEIPSLGLRISAGYGPGEYTKGKYASVVYQWCKQMKHGERPVIYGNGEQTRDFIYIDDVVDKIEELTNKHIIGIRNVCTGINTSFNAVVDIINNVLGKKIKPVYIGEPNNYVKSTELESDFRWKVTLSEGIERILNDKNL